MQHFYYLTLFICVVLCNSSCTETLIHNFDVEINDDYIGFDPKTINNNDAIDCNVAHDVTTLYGDDVFVVATQLLQLESSEVLIGESYQNEALRLLNAVYQSNSPARDSAVVQFNIHDYAATATKRLFMAADESHVWVQNLKNGLPSGNPIVDILVDSFDLSIHYENFLGVFVIEMPSNVVPAHLAQEFSNISGVSYAEVQATEGDGNRIMVNPQFGYTDITYSYGFGDCYAGCIGRWNWVFRVYPDCTTVHLSSYGTPIE